MKKTRFAKVWYAEPTKPKPGEKRFSQELLMTTGDRYHHFPDHEKIDEDNDPTSRIWSKHCISLADVNDFLKKENLNEKDIVFTASFRDDYLMLEIVCVKELNEKEQWEEYEQDCVKWKEQTRQAKEYELEKIKWQMESLQKQVDLLKKD